MKDEDDIDMHVRWFGENWGAPICEPEYHADTPIGVLCCHCGEAFVEGDKGMVLYPFEESFYHHDCFLREIVGSVGHQKGKCSCYGGDEEDPSGLTKRQAASVAVGIWQANQGMFAKNPPNIDEDIEQARKLLDQ